LGLNADPSAVCCPLEAFGSVRVPADGLAAVRKAPAPLGGRRIPPSLLKHGDHQTAIGLAALRAAVDDAGWQDREFTDWGLIAAPRFLGRIIAAGAMDKFKRLGVPGMSPLIIPTLSLHAVAGSLSLALKTQGFNYGVGGSHGHLAEALTCGLAACEDGGVPGVWLVVTQFSPEPVPDTAGGCLNAAVGYGLALAIRPEDGGPSRWTLGVAPTDPGRDAAVTDDRDVRGDDPRGGLVALIDFLAAAKGPDAGSGPRTWRCSSPGGLILSVRDAGSLAGVGSVGGA